jgi:hypothetical protein
VKKKVNYGLRMETKNFVIASRKYGFTVFWQITPQSEGFVIVMQAYIKNMLRWSSGNEKKIKLSQIK